MHRLHVLDACDAPALALAQERTRRLPVGRAGVFVAHIDGEEFEEAQRGFFPGVRDAEANAFETDNDFVVS
jgi:hypothetical protein